LEVKKLNVSWRGQLVVKKIIIEKKVGYLGQYNNPQIEGMVKIGHGQILTYTLETDLKIGQFHLNEEDK
jgi:hypothetical protein